MSHEMWVQMGIQAFVTLFAIGSAWVALQVRLAKLEVQNANIIQSLDRQGQEVRMIEQRLGKLENKVSAMEARRT
jgi:predicted nuclease with TOPRIM domain